MYLFTRVTPRKRFITSIILLNDTNDFGWQLVSWSAGHKLISPLQWSGLNQIACRSMQSVPSSGHLACRYRMMCGHSWCLLVTLVAQPGCCPQTLVSHDWRTGERMIFSLVVKTVSELHISLVVIQHFPSIQSSCMNDITAVLDTGIDAWKIGILQFYVTQATAANDLVSEWIRVSKSGMYYFMNQHGPRLTRYGPTLKWNTMC